MIKAKVNLLVQDDFQAIEWIAIKRVEDLDFSSQKYICSQYCYLDLKKPPKQFVRPVLRKPSSFSRVKGDQSPEIGSISDEGEEKILLRFKNITTGQQFQWEVDPNLSGFELLSQLNQKYPDQDPQLQFNEEKGNDAMLIQPENLATSSVKQFGFCSETILYVKTS